MTSGRRDSRRVLDRVLRARSRSRKFGLELRHPVLDAPAVRLELCLTRAPGANATPESAELDPAAPQPGQSIPVLGELDLHHPLAAGGVLGEYVEYQSHPIDNVTLEDLLQVALLRGRQLVVEDNHVDVERTGLGGELVCLSRADEQRSVGTSPFDQCGTDGVRYRQCR